MALPPTAVQYGCENILPLRLFPKLLMLTNCPLPVGVHINSSMGVHRDVLASATAPIFQDSRALIPAGKVWVFGPLFPK